MTVTALLAIIVATDPRVSHMALCRADCPPTPSAPPPVAKAERGCCSKASESRPHPPVDDCAACGCCQVVAGYRTERDARSSFVSPAPPKVDFTAVIGTFLAFAIAPPPVSVASSPAPVAVGAGSLPCLLCNHLRT